MRAEIAYAASVSAAALALAAGVATHLEAPDAASAVASVDRVGTPGVPLAGVRPATFVNFETPHVHPLDMTPDGQRLLAVNTAAGSLEVFSLASGSPVWVASVPVGVDPVSVRARNNGEAWVVNHVSDSVSVVDLSTMRVRATFDTKDEPCDVVFAGAPARAFVSCSQVNTVQVFDPSTLTSVGEVPINGEDPRALAVSPDGGTVYAAIFESGNASTSLGGGLAIAATLAFPPNVVSDPMGPWGGMNPPPNDGILFTPPIAPGNGTGLRVDLIVKRDDQGNWLDDNGGDWTDFVSGANASKSGRLPGWNLPDRDLAAIDASSLSVSYAHHLMNICMGVGVNPATGDIAVVGTDATNEIRYEPVINGTFLRVNLASVNAANLSSTSVVDLNPHLDYSTPTLPQSERDKSIGDPRAIMFNSAGTRAYVAGMGSNNVVVVDASGARAGLAQTIEVGEGPTGLALDEARSRLYVMNKFDGSISVVSTATELEVARVAFFDPTPDAIKAGRKHLYDTRKNSGLGYVACASCHVDARMDRLAWDLGDPSGGAGPLTGMNLGFGLPGLRPGSTSPAFASFHAMKGPMTTQTLQDIIGHEPHHWRGDRAGIEAFNGAFMTLQGDDQNLTPQEMQEFEDFLATIHFPPNPFRGIDNSLPTSMSLAGHYTTGRFAPAGQPLPNGNAQSGLALYTSTTRRLDGGAFACVTCHTLPTGMGPDMTLVGSTFQPIGPGPMGERHLGVVSVDGTTNITMKVPQLRNMHEKTGFNTTQLSNNAGFGYIHSGSVDSIERFIAEPAFNVASDQEIANLVAFMLSFAGSDLPNGSPSNPLFPPGPPSHDAHAAVGRQVTVVDGSNVPALQTALLSLYQNQADQGRVGMIAKGRVAGEDRGWRYDGAGVWQSDRAGETITHAALVAAAAPGGEITFTVVPTASATRLGIDRDDDSYFDHDEIDACADPSDGASTPLNSSCCLADWDNSDGQPNSSDFLAFLNDWASHNPRADLAPSGGNGSFDSSDFLAFLNAYAQGC
ncbi:MAG: GC-type dockerin domain-anchored protein [Phycisphaerales bacterium]|jgi:YVTN family beta-propeller protein|nr:GC-type dockerin domain-anchored protein [Phycisphaerales bacterium]